MSSPFRAAAEQVLAKFLSPHSNETTTVDSELVDVFNKVNTFMSTNQSQLNKVFDRWVDRTTFSFTQLISTHPSLYACVGMLAFALTVVTLGSFTSIKSIPHTALPPTKYDPLFDPTDFDLDTESIIVHKNETDAQKKKDGHKLANYDKIDVRHSLLIPLSCGAVLMTLYFFIKRLQVRWLSIIVKGLTYQSILSHTFAATFVYNYLIQSFIRNLSYLFKFNPLKILPRCRLTVSDDNVEIHQTGAVSNLCYKNQISGKIQEAKRVEKIKKTSWESHMYRRELKAPSSVKSDSQILNVYMSDATIYSFILACIISALYFWFPRNWMLTNIVSLNLSVWTISQLNLKNLKSGTMILLVLFFYDIYFVFYNDVMVTVATQLELPFKLSIPVKFNPASKKFDFSFLGLGDMIIPGMFIAMCYKFDIWKWHLKNVDREFHLLNWGYIGTYFKVALISYALSMVTCMLCLNIFNVAQPALLYIVPFLLISISVVAKFNNDFKDMWNLQFDVIEIDDEKLSSGRLEKEDQLTYSELLESDYIEDSDTDVNSDFTPESDDDLSLSDDDDEAED